MIRKTILILANTFCIGTVGWAQPAAKLDPVKAETDRAKAELERAKAEEVRAKAEMVRAQAETDRAQAETVRAKAEAVKALADQAAADKKAADDKAAVEKATFKKVIDEAVNNALLDERARVERADNERAVRELKKTQDAHNKAFDAAAKKAATDERARAESHLHQKRIDAVKSTAEDSRAFALALRCIAETVEGSGDGFNLADYNQMVADLRGGALGKRIRKTTLFFEVDAVDLRLPSEPKKVICAEQKVAIVRLYKSYACLLDGIVKSYDDSLRDAR